MVLPSGLTAMPSGSTPVGISPILRGRHVDHRDHVVVLVRHVQRVAGRRAARTSPDPARRAGRRRSSASSRSMIWMVSSSLAHTRMYLPSLVSRMPRGRWPTSIGLDRLHLVEIDDADRVVAFVADKGGVRASLACAGSADQPSRPDRRIRIARILIAVCISSPAGRHPAYRARSPDAGSRAAGRPKLPSGRPTAGSAGAVASPSHAASAVGPCRQRRRSPAP